MSVVAQISEVGPCRKRLEIQVPEAAVEAELERVVQTFRRHAKAPGFRKGKMPVEMVRQRYHEDIEKEVLDRLLPRYWDMARREKDLDPLRPPEVEDVSFEADSQLSFVATVEVRPDIELEDLESFDLPEMDVEAKDEEIEQAIERLRRDAGSWAEVDRPADQGDLVEGRILELDATDEAESEPHGHDVSFEVGDERVWPELTDVASGLASGDRAEFERRSEEDDEPAAKRFAIEVGSVKERELPELSDELAASLGKFESVEALRGAVVESIVASKRQERQQVRERAVLDQLRERHHFPLPGGVVESEIEGLLREYASGLATRGVDVENADIEWQELAEQIRPQATRQVEARLILDAVAKDREIEVPSEEIEATLADMAAHQGTSTVALRNSMSQSGNLEQLTMQLRRRRAMIELLGEEDDGAMVGDESDAEDDTRPSDDTDDSKG